MIVEFDKSFERSLKKVHDQVVLRRLKLLILKAERSTGLKQIPNIRKITGYSSYYRVRIGDYRVGIESRVDHTLRFIIIAHRKDIYKLFP